MHLKLTIEYDGTDFVGSQLQSAGMGRTVQGELEKALERLAGETLRIAMAGRTDSGVHARGQVASVTSPAKARLDTPRAVQKALNGILPADVAVTHAESAPEGFHARYSASKRCYRYLLWNAEAPMPLLSRYSLHIKRRLDTGAMQAGARMIEGTHDLAAFAGQGMGVPVGPGADTEERPSTVRTVYAARLTRLDPKAGFWSVQAPEAPGGESKEEGTLLALDLVANAFLPQMIRTIVGTLLEVGYGRLLAEDVSRIIESRDRKQAGPTARPQGLCLLWVSYES